MAEAEADAEAAREGRATDEVFEAETDVLVLLSPVRTTGAGPAVTAATEAEVVEMREMMVEGEEEREASTEGDSRAVVEGAAGSDLLEK